MRILADTNVIIDALTSREPWNKRAEEIFPVYYTHLDVYKRQETYLLKGEAGTKTINMKAHDAGLKGTLTDLSLIHI